MLDRTAVACYALSVTAVAVSGRTFPEMTIWSVALLLVALLQVIRLFKPALLIFALPLAFLTAALSCLAVLLSLLGGTIGGSFHIDPEAQPVLWALAGVSFSGFLLLVAQVRLVLLRRRNSSTSS